MKTKLAMVVFGVVLGGFGVPGWGSSGLHPVLGVLAATPGVEATAAPAKQLYTCGMHPQVLQDHPGDCPICGMRLTPVRREPDAGIAESASTISIDPVTVQNMNLRTGLVTKGPLRRVLRTVGVVDYDETAMTDVTTKFKGWIEKLYVNATGQLVHKGDPLFEIYAPELYSAQAEYLLALKQAAGGNLEFLRDSALAKLRFFDISEGQIAELEKTRAPKKTLQVFAPRDGIVMEKMVVEGQLADMGMRLFRIGDLGTVWVQAQVYEQDLPFVKLGQAATVALAYQPDRQYRGRVTYVYPSVDAQTRTVKVRLEFHNPGYALKPGMFVAVKLEAELAKAALLVPDLAVLRSGETNTVFVALAGGRFEPRTVTLGPRGEGGMYQVVSGLAEGEKVVTSGQFMLDSESQLRGAIQKMTRAPEEPRPAVGSGAGAAPAAEAPGGPVPEPAPPPVYICPMPEHVAIAYEKPGACPLCGMELIPVSRELLAKIQPGEVVGYYTCPMPEHADVHEAKSGKCPKCGMTLVPVMKTAVTASGTAEPAKAWYVCPMPEDAVRSARPGNCPKCGMKLVPEAK